MKGTFWLADTVESNPLPWIVSAKVPCCSSQARTQREQTMHLVASKVKYGLLVSFSPVRWFAALATVAHFAQSHDARHVLQFAVPVGGTGQAVKGMVGDIEFHHAAANVGNLLVLRGDFYMPCATGVVQEA